MVFSNVSHDGRDDAKPSALKTFVSDYHFRTSLKQRIIRNFIEPACGTIERDKYETRSESAVGVAFEQE